MQVSSSIFQNMLGALAQEHKAVATLYFNFDNPTVKKMMELDESDLKIFVEFLYVQALQIGGFTLHQKERGVFNRSILALIERNLQIETER